MALMMGAYLGLAPIYWLPGLDPDLLGAAKVSLFAASAALICMVALLEDRGGLPSGLLGPLGLALFLAASVTGLIQADSAYDAASAVKDCVLAFCGLWVFHQLARLGVDVERLLLGSALVAAGACALVASSGYLGWPDVSGPSRYDATHLWISGFGSVRTGWADGTALYVVPLLFPFAGTTRSKTLKALCVCGIAAIMLSQFLVSGRAGLAASLLAVAVALNGRGRRRALAALGLGLGLVVAGNIGEIKRQLRFVRENDAAYELDDMSGGRVDQALSGVDKALERPLFGAGAGRAWIGTHEIHNLWLRLAAESGIPCPLALFLIAVQAVLGAARARAPGGGPPGLRERAYLGGLLGGLLMTFLEPRMVMGAFQVTALWWAFAGAVSSRGLSGERPVLSPAALPAPS